jgi:2-polyprenyl-3-methyl-5-hydroxy-6-metoxy-1,4-benzoquinol methylase
MIIRNIQYGIDALSFVDSLEGGWDCVIWDPPYKDPKNPVHQEQINKRRRSWYDRNNRFKPTNNTRFLDLEYRNQVLDLVKSKMAANCKIVYFNTKYKELPTEKGCEHTWVKLKNIGVISGSGCPDNGEHFKIVPPVKREKGKILSRYVAYKAPSDGIIIKRGCAKPIELMRDILRHCSATFVLDPFVGLGEIIFAAAEMGVNIDACDIDDSIIKSDVVDLEAWI